MRQLEEKNRNLSISIRIRTIHVKNFVKRWKGNLYIYWKLRKGAKSSVSFYFQLLGTTSKQERPKMTRKKTKLEKMEGNGSWESGASFEASNRVFIGLVGGILRYLYLEKDVKIQSENGYRLLSRLFRTDDHLIRYLQHQSHQIILKYLSNAIKSVCVCFFSLNIFRRL